MHPHNMNRRWTDLQQILETPSAPALKKADGLLKHNSQFSTIPLLLFLAPTLADSPVHTCLTTGLHLCRSPPAVPPVGHPPPPAKAFFERTITCRHTLAIRSKLVLFTIYEYGSDRVFRNVGA